MFKTFSSTTYYKEPYDDNISNIIRLYDLPHEQLNYFWLNEHNETLKILNFENSWLQNPSDFSRLT